MPARCSTWIRLALCCQTLCLLIATAVGADDVPIPVLDWTPRSDWLNVHDFGARGDGEADDTAAIQAALDKVGNGGVVYLPAGTFRITETLLLARSNRMLGVGFIGHGRLTRLVWDGAEGGAIFHPDGVSYGHYQGIVFDGRGRAGVGITNRNRFFETETEHRHLAFIGFTDAGFLVHPERRQAVSEPLFTNCYFANNRRGIAFTRFNDYNFVIANCEFRENDIGIECRNGQFLLRNSHFAGNRQVDILANPHHASSIRRCTSNGSRAFLHFGASSAAFAIQDVHVAGWTDPAGAIRLNGAPVTLFDSRFTMGPADQPPIHVASQEQRLIYSNTKVDAGELLKGGNPTYLYEVVDRQRGPVIASATRRFLQSTVQVPGKVFDVKRDFGAVGDNRADDTAAIQAAIDAAREHGEQAIAYLPLGTYRITETLRMSGADYHVGGASSGFHTQLRWAGQEDGVMIAIHNPRNLVLSHLSVGHHDGGRMNNGIDILQTSDRGHGTSMIYDGVWTYGVYQQQAERKGFVFRDLGAGDRVLLRHVQGNLRVENCAGAELLGNVAHEGSLTVRGYRAPDDGLLGIIVRLATKVTHALYVHDNASLVLSDCYKEQSAGMFHLTGSGDLPPGRVTWTGGRSHVDDKATEPTMTIADYRGEIFLGGKDFSDYRWLAGAPDRQLRQSGAAAVSFTFFGNLMMGCNLTATGDPAFHFAAFGNQSHGHGDWQNRVPVPDRYEAKDLAALGRALDDLSRLGAYDLEFNSPDPDLEQ